MPVYNVGNEIYHTRGLKTIWSTLERPALLLPDYAISLSNFDISFPDFTKSNLYGFDIGTQAGFTSTACMSMISINPQEWDSGLSLVTTLPSMCNYFEIEVTAARIVTPSTFLGLPIPSLLGPNVKHLLDGGSVICERIGPIARLFRFERSGNALYLRRKQSVQDQGNLGIWTPNNAVYNPNTGAKLEGFTYGGSPNALPAYYIESKAGGNINKCRGEVNACSLSDPSNYASTWRCQLTITPGYIAP